MSHYVANSQVTGLSQLSRGDALTCQEASGIPAAGVAYRSREAGFMDRANDLPLLSTDAAYLRGYCERIIFEIDQELGRSNTSQAVL